jgi:hypothetical protein
MEEWTVVVDIRFIRDFLKDKKYWQHEFEAFQRKVRASGPSAIGWDPPDLISARSWEEISEPYRRDFWLIFGSEFLRVPLEILPGRTVRVWHPESE